MVRDPFPNNQIPAELFSPTFVNEFRGGFNRVVVLNVGGNDIGNLGNLAAELGIAGGNERGPGLPALRFSGAATDIGNARNVSNFYNNTFQLSDNLSITRGNHIIKTGFQMLRYQLNSYFAGNNGQMGFFNFNGQYSRDLSNPASRGNAIADFILGYPSGMGRGILSGTWGHRNSLWAGFIQDDWRILPNLTLNLGLRYEYVTPLVEVRDRQANWDLATGEELFAGQDGNSRAVSQQWNLTLERQLGTDFTLSAGYLGQHGTHLIVPVDFNQRRLGETARPLDHVLPQIGFVVLTDSIGNQRYDAL